MDHRLTLFRTVIALVCCLTIPHSLRAQEGDHPGLSRSLPLTSALASSYSNPANRMSIVQQRAMFEADQRLLREQWYEWIGYSPLRPDMNASYMSNGLPRYYLPSRGIIVNSAHVRSWYW